MNLFLSHNITKTFMILLLFLTNILLTGCWDSREVNDTALVLGAALDKAKGKHIKLTVQVLIPSVVSGGQQGAGGGGGARVMVRSTVGENMADAASKLQTKIPRKVFWGHCKTYTISKKLAKMGGIREHIDFLLRHPEPRERAYLFVSEGEAADVMKFKPTLELYTGEGIRRLSEMHIGASATIKDFEQMLTGDTETALLPLVSVSLAQDGKKEKKLTSAYKTAIFKKGKMVGQIDLKATRGLLWLRNEIEVTVVTVHPKKGESISIGSVQQKTKLVPTINNGKWNILAKVTSEGIIMQNGSHLDMMSPQIIKKIEKEVEKDIKDRMNLSLKQVKEDMNADAFSFADAFHRKYPKEWGKVKDHWDEILPHVSVKVDVKMRVRRSGLITRPAGLKEKEVEKK